MFFVLYKPSNQLLMYKEQRTFRNFEAKKRYLGLLEILKVQSEKICEI